MGIKKIVLLSMVSILSLGALSVPGTAFADPVPINDLARNPAITGVRMSPDGKHIAALVSVEGQKKQVISIWKTDNLKAKPVWIPTKEMRYRFVGFIGNDKIIFQTDQPLTRGQKEDFTRKIYIADLDGRNIEEPMKSQGTLNDAVRNVENRNSTVGFFNTDFEDQGYILLNKTNVSNGSQEIYQLDLKTEKTKHIATGGSDWNYLSSMVDPATGELLGKSELINKDGDFWTKIYLRPNKNAPWVYHPNLSERLKDRRNISIVGFDGGPDKLLVLSNANTEFQKAYTYHISSQKLDVVAAYENPKYDVLDIVMTTKAGQYQKPIAVRIGNSRADILYIDGYWKQAQSSLKRKFPGKNVSISSRSDKLKQAIITVSDSQTPPSYFIYDNGKLEALGSSRPWLKSADIGKSKWISYTARDGLKIPAILTLPPNYTRSKGRISAIVLPHGGPWSRDRMGWDSSGWIAYLTSRNVAVIQPQYRGTTGLGMKLHVAGDKEWGQKMSDDNDDAAAYLVSQKIADPNKLAIFGYSYGGFAAIAASVRPNSPYQCAISGAGVSSLERIGNLWGGNRIVKERQAWTVKGMDPIKNVDKANIPILLYHGSGDRQADTEHSRIFYKAMKRAGKDVKYVEIDKMWHQIPWWPEWATESLTEIDNFLKSSKCNIL